MAELIGFLREDATHGEKQVLKLFRRNLPKEFVVYVESPIRTNRDIRFADFVVVMKYDVTVLTVKNWVTLPGADMCGASVRDRKGSEGFGQNSVTKAREFAITLFNELNRKIRTYCRGKAIRRNCAAVLANLPYSVITQSTYGELFREVPSSI